MKSPKKCRQTSSPPDFSAEEYEAMFTGKAADYLVDLSKEEMEIGAVSCP
jgi:hypothetical protein